MGNKPGKVLFVSKELIAADLAYQIKKEGYDIRLFIDDECDKECFDGMVEKSDDWKNDLDWVGKDGTIVFDDVGYGKIQDELRESGYSVVGGGLAGDRLETDREYGQELMKKFGVFPGERLETLTLTVDEAISFLKERGGEWVMKQQDHNNALTYIGSVEDGSDVINMLESYRDNYGGENIVSLQEKVKGVEVAVGRFFNGNDWCSPIVINFEHKNLCNDDLGPLGGETGTLMWYEKDEKNKLFQRTLQKFEDHLRSINYHGYFDINCIVSDENTLYPLEITSRFGSSTIETQCEIHKSHWGEFLRHLARGEDFNLDYEEGYAINVALTVPPFPYKTSDKRLSQRGVGIFFKDSVVDDDWKHVHFEEVAMREDSGKEKYSIADDYGYVLYITGIDKDVLKSRKKVYDIINKILIPKMFYRTDIGLRFLRKDQKILKKWGWI